MREAGEVDDGIASSEAVGKLTAEVENIIRRVSNCTSLDQSSLGQAQNTPQHYSQGAGNTLCGGPKIPPM
jgi:hypothetical protein